MGETKAVPVTVIERCRERKLRFTHAQLSKIGRRTAAIYRRVYDADPPVVTQGTGLGSFSVPLRVYAYARPDAPMIDAAIDSVLNDQPAPYPISHRKAELAESGPQDHEAWERWKQDVLLVMALQQLVRRPGSVEWIRNFCKSVTRWVKGDQPLTDKQRSVIETEIAHHMRKEDWDKVVADWCEKFGEDFAPAEPRSTSDEPSEF